MSAPAYFTRSRAKLNQRKISLYEIPNHILFKILYKMPGKELTRMRKTCRFVNQKVEDNKELFSKNVQVGIYVAVEVRARVDDSGKTDLFFGCDSKKQLSQIVSLDSPFEHHFSGVPIRALSVRGQHCDHGVIAIFLERLKLRCAYFMIDIGASVQYLVDLADLVDSGDTDFSPWFFEGADESVLSIFRSGRRSSTYCICMPIALHILEKPEILTDFKVIYINSKVPKQQLCSFMKALTNLKSTGTLEELSINFPKRNPFTEKKSNFPPAKVLWKKADLSHHPYGDEIPDYIWKMGLVENGKCAIVIKRSDYKEASIKFIKNTPEDILKILAGELIIKEFESLHKEMYLEADEDEQTKMLHDYYKKKYAVYA